MMTNAGKLTRFFVLMLLTGLIVQPSHAGAQYTTTSDWGSGFNGQIVATNDTGQTLTGWTLEFDFVPNISSMWDASIASHVGTHYVLKSAGWNDTITPGGKVSLGFGGSPGHIITGPTHLVLRGVSAAPPTPTPTPAPAPVPAPTPTPTPVPAGVSVTITQTSGWSGGFGANLDITNGGTQTINSWTLKFGFVPMIQSLWNGTLTSQGSTYTVTNASWNGSIPPGGKVSLGFTGAGTIDVSSASGASVNGVPCPVTVVPGVAPTPGNPGGSTVVIGGGIDTSGEATQITVRQDVSSYPLTLSKGGNAAWAAVSNNPDVALAQIVNGTTLQIRGMSAGRAGLRLQDTLSGAVRYIGVRVCTADGQLPGLPPYLAIGSVSEDTDDHLAFWHGFGTGAKNRRIDARYIYLNGGPTYGWTTWTATPGDRAARYIRESRKIGAVPIFVWYNIPDGGESYDTDMAHIQSASYLQSYYQMLHLLTGIIKTESPDDPVIMILEPDFLGYLAQNSGRQASQIAAQTSAATDAGYLKPGVDPQFPNTVQGLVQSINYLIARDAPQTIFGWQMNLWASPAGGWTSPVGGKGIVHLTDSTSITQGRTAIYNEARAITQYYLNAGVTSYGAKFLSIDKYGLDAGTAEASASADPASSLWFWNADQWSNYLVFVRAMHETSGLPVVLWQLPVGHINHSTAFNPYVPGSTFPDLLNHDSQGEDSAPTYFFGDTFLPGVGLRGSFFGTNRGADPTVSASGNTVTWGEHLSAAAASGVTMALFGAGVGGSTTNVGAPPTDSLWWISKAQSYYAQPVAIPLR